MTTIIDDRIITEVKSRADIVDVIGKYTELNKKGSSYMGLCPFHNEKTPSFSVLREKGYFHCFGCGEAGDVISFIMKKENLTFTEAVTKLAEDFQVHMQEYSPEEEKKIKWRERQYEMNRQAAIYYMKLLSRHKYGLEYLNKRGIDKKTIVKFGMGFAPAGGSELLKYMCKLGYKEEELFKNNLVSKNEKRGNYFDRFRNRIIFPIIDIRSRVLGFGGRVLDDSMPKYLNSSETSVFHKGSNLYGLNIIHKESERKKILLVEGYMDVISLYKSGINYATASLGTALTREQAKLIKRYGREVYICYDGDTAGLRATNRAINVLFQEDIRPKIVQLPDSMDPDDFIRKYGSFEFESILTSSISAIDFRIKESEKNFQLTNPESFSNFLQEVARILGGISSPVEQEVYIDRVAEKYGISRESLRLEMGRKTSVAKAFKPETKVESSQKVIEYDLRFVQLVYYGLESKELFHQMSENKFWKWLINNDRNILLRDLEKLYQNTYEKAEERYEDYILSHPEISGLIDKMISSFDSIKAEQIIDELLESLYLDGLKNRSKYLINKISKLEKDENLQEKELIELKQGLEELSEVSKRLRETEEGGFN